MREVTLPTYTLPTLRIALRNASRSATAYSIINKVESGDVVDGNITFHVTDRDYDTMRHAAWERLNDCDAMHHRQIRSAHATDYWTRRMSEARDLLTALNGANYGLTLVASESHTENDPIYDAYHYGSYEIEPAYSAYHYGSYVGTIAYDAYVDEWLYAYDGRVVKGFDTLDSAAKALRQRRSLY